MSGPVRQRAFSGKCGTGVALFEDQYSGRVSRPERPAPPPLEGNDRVITGVITAGWAVALIVLLIVRDSLPYADRWWVWVAAFGTFMGLFGLAYVPHLKRSRDRAAERRRLAGKSPGGAGQDS
jgi:hypothetical protein